MSVWVQRVESPFDGRASKLDPPALLSRKALSAAKEEELPKGPGSLEEAREKYITGYACGDAPAALSFFHKLPFFFEATTK